MLMYVGNNLDTHGLARPSHTMAHTRHAPSIINMYLFSLRICYRICFYDYISCFTCRTWVRYDLINNSDFLSSLLKKSEFNNNKSTIDTIAISSHIT